MISLLSVCGRLVVDWVVVCSVGLLMRGGAWLEISCRSGCEGGDGGDFVFWVLCDRVFHDVWFFLLGRGRCIQAVGEG